MTSAKNPEMVRNNLFGGVGSVRVTSLLSGGAEPFTAILACELTPAGSVGAHRQEEFPEIILGCSGTGSATIDGVTHPLEAGAALFLPLGSVLALQNLSSTAPLVYFIVKARS
ncbi:MAG TPA: cupin domain-containing protein [Polyangiales bacterium]|nr:cupin domain-containing protein [Polyangiales bacterium]